MTVRRRMPREQRRETLTVAARELVMESGYVELTMERVAKRAGVSKTLVYDHFANRRDLFLAVLAEEHVRIMQAVAPAVATGDRETRVRNGVAAFLRIVDEYGPGFAELFHHPVGQDPELAAEIMRVRKGVADLLAAVIAGEIGAPIEDARLPAAAIVGAMEHAADWLTLTPDGEKISIDAAASTLSRMIWQGLDGLAEAAGRADRRVVDLRPTQDG